MDEEGKKSTAKDRIVKEIQRVAKLLGVDRLSRREFDEHHELGGASTAGNLFGSWNLAVKAAGLQPYPTGGSSTGPKINDDELLREIIRIHVELGKTPSERNMNAFGKFSIKPYRSRWGTFVDARKAAYLKYGKPDDTP